MLGKTEVPNIDNKRLIIPDEAGVDSSAVSSVARNTGIHYYDSIGALPVTGLTEGDQAFVASSGGGRLYISNGSGWYNAGGFVNLSPTVTIDPDGIVQLSQFGATSVVTLTATDSDNANFTFTLDSDGNLDQIATFTSDSSVFTFTPRSFDSVPEGYTDSSTVTFTASDGINSAVANVSLKLDIRYYDSPNYPFIWRRPEPMANVFGSVFGATAAVSADGLYLVASDWKEGSSQLNTTGKNFVFVRDSARDNEWTHRGSYTPATAGNTDRIGSRGVDIGDDGEIVIATFDQYNSGAGCVMVHKWGGSSYDKYQYLQPTTNPPDTFINGNNDRECFFGRAVALSSDGEKIVAGHPRENWGGITEDNDNVYGWQPGSLYVFARDSGTTVSTFGDRPFAEEAILRPPTAEKNLGLGYRSVTISGNGQRVACGASNYQANKGTLFLWSMDSANGTWDYDAQLTPSGLDQNDYFGWHSDMTYDGNIVVSGAHWHPYDENRGGKVWLWERAVDSGHSATWNLKAEFTPTGLTTDSDARFGWSAKISGDGSKLIIGSDRDQEYGYSGAVYVYYKGDSAGHWISDKKLQHPGRGWTGASAMGYGDDHATNDGNGQNIDIDSAGNIIIAGNGEGGGPDSANTYLTFNNGDYGAGWAWINNREM